METIFRDIKYAARSLRRQPLFTLTAVCILALAIGSATAVFSAVDRLLFQSMPYPEPGRLVSVGVTLPFVEGEFLFGSTYIDWRTQSLPFDKIGSWTGSAGCDLTEANPVRLNCAVIDAQLLPTLGTSLVAGRNFTSDEDRPAGAKSALISYRLWQSRFGGQAGVIDRVISIDGTSTRIVGVLPRNFELPNLGEADLVLPEALDRGALRPGPPLRIIGRLKQGITIEQAKSQLGPVFEAFKQSAPAPLRPQTHLVLRSLADYQTGDLRQSSWLLFGSVLLILLVACANIASLLLARAASRQQEVAVRTALGATRKRLLQQVLTESLLLSTMGSLLGCVAAAVLLPLFTLLAPPHLTRLTINGRVLLFALILSVMSGTLFSLAPALMPIGADTLTGRTIRQTRRDRLRQVLTSSQVALSLVLLMLAAVFLQSLRNLRHVALGMNTSHVMVAEPALDSNRYASVSAREQFLASLEDRVRRLPGASAVAISDTVPPGGFIHTRPMRILQPAGRPAVEDDTGQIVAWRTVTPDYFRALGIRLLRGRTFDDRDRTSRDLPIILSRALAQQLFGRADPIGKTIVFNSDRTNSTVVGITEDVKNGGPAASATPEYYLVRKRNQPEGNAGNSLLARTLNVASSTIAVIVRANGEPGSLTAWIRSSVKAADQTLPVQISMLDTNVERLSARPRFEALLLLFFGGTALLLATVGIYGLIAFLVAQKFPEIGVRMALGATPQAIKSLFLKRALRLLLGGIAAGAIGAAIILRLVRSLLFNTAPLDPFLFLEVVTLLLVAGLVAAYLPAHRAGRMDPMAALRKE